MRCRARCAPDRDWYFAFSVCSASRSLRSHLASGITHNAMAINQANKKMKMCIFAAVVAALEDRYRASQGATPAFPTGLPLGRVCADTCVGVAALVCVCLYVCLSCLYVHARVCARIVCNTQARERICCQRLRHQCRGQLWCGGGTTRSLALWTFLPMSCERRLSVDQ